jgi:hypothetical protein
MFTPLLILKQNLLFNHGSRSLAAWGAAVNAHFLGPGERFWRPHEPLRHT